MKLQLIDKNRRAVKQWTAEEDAQVEASVRAIYAFFGRTAEDREAWLERAMTLGLDQVTPGDGPDALDLAQMAYFVKAELGALYKSEILRRKRLEKYEQRKSGEFVKLRYEVLLERGNKCECCGREPPEVVIHVDHIKPVSKYPELALDPQNLQVLCRECNLGKRDTDETDWRKK